MVKRLLALYSLSRLLAMTLPIGLPMLMLFDELSTSARLLGGSYWLAGAYLVIAAALPIEWVWTVVLHRKAKPRLAGALYMMAGQGLLGFSFLLIFSDRYEGALIWIYGWAGLITILLGARLAMPFSRAFLSADANASLS